MSFGLKTLDIAWVLILINKCLLPLAKPEN
jgi:hypothetical protein